MLTRPGRLTADYARGRRKPSLPPLQLFLIGSNTLTTDLNPHLHYTWHNAIAQALVTPRRAARAVSANAYAAVFDPAAVTQARSLVILVVPFFSLAVMAFHWRHWRHYTAHPVFSLHFCAFWLLLICATLALTNLAVRLLRYAHVFPSAGVVRQSIIVFNLAIMPACLFRAVRVVF